MSRINRGGMALALTSALAIGALVGPSVAPAKTKTVKYKIVDHSVQTGTKLSGKFTGTFGKGTVTGISTPPVVTPTFHVKGGTLTFHIKDGHLQGAFVVATYKITGTGKFKKAKGKGKLKAELAKSIYTFTGTVKY